MKTYDFQKEPRSICVKFSAASGGQKNLGFCTLKTAISRGKTVQKRVPETKNLSSGWGSRKPPPLYSGDFLDKGGGFLALYPLIIIPDHCMDCTDWR